MRRKGDGGNGNGAMVNGKLPVFFFFFFFPFFFFFFFFRDLGKKKSV